MHTTSGKKVIYLSPYSPDFSPIEPSFGWVKSLTQRDEMLCQDMSIIDDHEAHLATITRLHWYIFSITPKLARSWFHHCNYIWMKNGGLESCTSPYRGQQQLRDSCLQQMRGLPPSPRGTLQHMIRQRVCHNWWLTGACNDRLGLRGAWEDILLLGLSEYSLEIIIVYEVCIHVRDRGFTSILTSLSSLAAMVNSDDTSAVGACQVDHCFFIYERQCMRPSRRILGYWNEPLAS